MSQTRNEVFDCHVSPERRHMAIKNTVSSYFDPRSSIVKGVFDCRLSGVVSTLQSLLKNHGLSFKFLHALF